MKLKAGHMVAERYEIDDVIGSGGMSVVYRAHDKKLDRYITLKVLKEEYLTDENLIERFPKEARAAAALNHQNIVSIYDHGRDGDILYIVLEYIDGASLKELINRKAPFDDETNLGVAIQVAEGLSEAHRNSIIHLDIKPQNILVTTTSIVKVTDFGIARVAKSVTLNAAAGSMGSVHYFSPEQARGGYIDHKSDIYSLGIVMYEMATGELPFDGENEVSIALQHINDPLPDISKINPDVSDSIIKIINKATEKSASKRYQTIDDMTDDLKRALTDASGAFVAVESHDESPTRAISEENKEVIRRQKMRQAFLDGEDMPDDDEEPTFILHSESRKNAYSDYQEGQEYGEYDEYADSYYDDYREPAPLKNPRDKKADRVAVYGGIGLGLVLAGIIILLAIYLWKNKFSPDAGKVETPYIIGMAAELADIEIRRLGLTPMRGEDQFCEDDECEGGCEGTVLSQGTEAGRPLSPEDAVQYTVSLGKPGEAALMPRVESTTLDDAIDTLEALEMGLIIQPNYIDDEEFPIRNYVIEQNPPPQTRLTFGQIVTLTVSHGTDDSMVTVPHLVGLTDAEVLNALRRHSLIPNLVRIENDLVEAGRVIRTEPREGDVVERNTRVTYYISTGPEVQEVSPTPTPTPETSPTPSPDPSASPEPTDTPEPTPTETTPTPDQTTPTVINETMTIGLGGNIPEGTEVVRVMVLQQTGNADPEVLTNARDVSVSLFPFNYPVSYSEPTRFIIEIYTMDTGVLLSRAYEDFS